MRNYVHASTRILTFALSMVLLVALCLSACGRNDGKGDQTTSDKGKPGVPGISPVDFSKLDLGEYIKIGKYEGVEVNYEKKTLTEEDYKKYIEDLVRDHPAYDKIKEGTAKAGDYVNINYVGRMNGEKFDGGSADDVNLYLNDNSGYIPGFAEGIIGMKIGDTFDVKVTFPEQYHKKDFAGKEAVFTMTLNHVNKALEFGDEYVKEISANIYSSVKEFEVYAKRQLQEILDREADKDAARRAWKKVLDSSEVLKYPEEQLEYCRREYTNRLRESASRKSMSLEEYMKATGTDESKIEEEIKFDTKQRMAFYRIIKEKNISISDKEYAEELGRVAAQYELSPAEVEQIYGKAAFTEDMLFDKVVSKVYEWASVTGK